MRKNRKSTIERIYDNFFEQSRRYEPLYDPERSDPERRMLRERIEVERIRFSKKEEKKPV